MYENEYLYVSTSGPEEFIYLWKNKEIVCLKYSMKKIYFFDPVTQYQKRQQEIDNAILSVIRSGTYINGPEVQQFSEALSKFTQANYVIPCGNGTDALQVALMALNLKPGDEVIVPAFTYVAPAEAIGLLGLIPVFVDVDAATFNIDVQKIRQAVTNHTKAIIPVHLFGQAADMEPILQIAFENGLAVIEDNAQSLGAVYSFLTGEKKQCGTIGDIGCLSFFPTKNLGCFGDGGAVLTNDEILYKSSKMKASHGQSKKYYHEVVGCNSRLDTLQAAVLNVKLQYMEEDLKRKQHIAGYYYKNLADLSDVLILPVQATYSTHTYHQFTIRVKNGRRDALHHFLAQESVPSMVYYPLALPEQPAFHPFKREKAEFPVAESLCRSALSLPIHPELNEEQLEYIVLKIKSFF